MKRLLHIAVCLVFLLPVLVVPAFASSSYMFYLFEPIDLYGNGFDFSADGSYYVYEGLLPAGYYTASTSNEFEGVELEVVLADEYFYYPGGSYSGTLSGLCYINGSFQMEYDFNFEFEYQDDVTVLYIDLSETGFSPSDFPVFRFDLVESVDSFESDIIHTNLFGSFLICGTLVGLSLFKGNRYA